MFVYRSWNTGEKHRQELKREFGMTNRIHVIRKGTGVEEKWNLSEEYAGTVCGVETA